MPPLRPLALLIGVICIPPPLLLRTAEAELRAGAATVDITPQTLPIAVSGSFTNREATGIHDRLHARCLVLDDGQRRVAVTVCDSLLLTRDIFDSAKSAAAQATGIPAAHMLMAATHTHSGPAAVPLGKLRPDPDYVAYLKRQLAASVVAADKRLQKARIGWAVGRAPEEVNNRRWFVKPEAILPNPFGRTDDQVRTNPPRGSDVLHRPAGPVDPDVSLLSVRTSDGQPLAIVANYSLHYVGNTPRGQLSADYFGEFDRQIGRRLDADDDLVAMLTNGTSGDINNVRFKQPGRRAAPFERIREVAARVAEIVQQSIASAEHHEHITLEVRERTLTLGVRRPRAEEIARAKELLSAASDPERLTRDEVYAFETVRLADWPATVEVPLQVVRIGKLGIVALPCEAFAEIGLEIKRRSHLRPTFIIGLANGYNGYLPTPEQHALGGYETWRSSWSYLEPEASVNMTDAVVEMLQAVGRAASDSASK